jgi:hypothetical protein
MIRDAFFTAAVAIALALVSGLLGWIIGKDQSMPARCLPRTNILDIRES